MKKTLLMSIGIIIFVVIGFLWQRHKDHSSITQQYATGDIVIGYIGGVPSVTRVNYSSIVVGNASQDPRKMMTGSLLYKKNTSFRSETDTRGNPPETLTRSSLELDNYGYGAPTSGDNVYFSYSEYDSGKLIDRYFVRYNLKTHQQLKMLHTGDDIIGGNGTTGVPF